MFIEDSDSNCVTHHGRVRCTSKERGRLYPLLSPPPELPRLQWLAAFTGAKDIEQDKSAFDKFVTGEQGDLRRLDKPYGVAVYDGKIYVCDTNRTVMVFDFRNHSFGRSRARRVPGNWSSPSTSALTGKAINM